MKALGLMLGLLIGSVAAAEDCGRVNGIAVQVEAGTVYTCSQALARVQSAVARSGYAFDQPWTVRFTWKFPGMNEHGVTDGATYAAKRLTLVQVYFAQHVFHQGPALHHELLHVMDAMRGVYVERDR